MTKYNSILLGKSHDEQEMMLLFENKNKIIGTFNKTNTIMNHGTICFENGDIVTLITPTHSSSIISITNKNDTTEDCNQYIEAQITNTNFNFIINDIMFKKNGDCLYQGPINSKKLYNGQVNCFFANKNILALNYQDGIIDKKYAELFLANNDLIQLKASNIDKKLAAQCPAELNITELFNLAKTLTKASDDYLSLCSYISQLFIQQQQHNAITDKIIINNKKYTATQKTMYFFYQPRKEKNPNNTGWKLHVSLDDSDTVSMQLGYSIIRDVLIKHNIDITFKIVKNNLHLIDPHHGNQVTIYCYKDNTITPKQWKNVCEEIDSKLTAAQVRPDPFDKLTPTKKPLSKFISCRNDDNGENKDTYIHIKDTDFYMRSDQQCPFLSLDVSGAKELEQEWNNLFAEKINNEKHSIW